MQEFNFFFTVPLFPFIDSFSFCKDLKRIASAKSFILICSSSEPAFDQIFSLPDTPEFDNPPNAAIQKPAIDCC